MLFLLFIGSKLFFFFDDVNDGAMPENFIMHTNTFTNFELPRVPATLEQKRNIKILFYEAI